MLQNISKINITSILVILALFASVFAFDASAQTAPTVSTGSADMISSRNVYLNASVNPNGRDTQVWFEFGTSQSFGSNRGHQRAGNGSSTVAIRAGIINLRLGTTYYYRAVAQNVGGLSRGETRTFTTPTETGTGGVYGTPTPPASLGAPLVATNGPASVNASSATVNGSINPNGSQTNFWFEFGPTTGLGRTTPVQALGNSSSWQLVFGNLTSLDFDKAYYYRVVAQNSFGTNRGSLVSLNTSAASVASYNGQVQGVSSANTNGSNSSAVKSGLQNKTNGQLANGLLNGSSISNAILLEHSVNSDGSLVLIADNMKPDPGEELGYTVVYKNITPKILDEVNLKVIIPVGADYAGSNMEPSDISGNVIEFNLDSIKSNDRGAVVILAKIKNNMPPEAKLIFTAVMTYADQFGNRSASTAYMTVKVGGTAVGSANSLLSSLFGSMIGSEGILWLVALMLIILMALLAYRLIKIRKGVNSKKQNDNGIDIEKIPATFEPVKPPMDRADIFIPVK